MKSISDTYAELISLTQLYLLREHSLKEIKIVDPTVVEYFKGRTNQLLSPAVPKNTQQSTMTLSQPMRQQPIASQIPVHQVQQPPHAIRPSSIVDSSPVIQSQGAQTELPTLPPHVEAAPSPLHTQAPQIQPLQASESPPIKVTPSQNKEGKGKGFSLEPLVVNPPQDHREWWDVSRSLFPQWKLQTFIPTDEIAQKNKNAWLKSQEITPVIILSFQDNEQQVAFLKNIAQAISLRLAPAQVISATRIEKDNGWEKLLNSPQLSLVIAGDYGLYLHPKLRQFHKEVPQQAKHFLNQTPLLLLSDLNLYLKDPQLKPLLWRAICNEFATSQSHRESEKIENCPT